MMNMFLFDIVDFLFTGEMLLLKKIPILSSSVRVYMIWLESILKFSVKYVQSLKSYH